MLKKWRAILANVLAMLMLYLPAALAAGYATYNGFTTRNTGYTIQATDWNNEFSLFIADYNTKAIGTFNLIANAGKGALLTWTGANFAALGNAGAADDGKALQLDSTQTNGIKWAALSNVTTLTTKGDLLGYSTNNARVPVGADGTVLTADSTNLNGVSWKSGALPSGVILMWSGSIASIPAGFQLCNGTNGTPNLQGLFVVCAGNSSPAATGGMGLLSPGGPSGDNSAGTGLGPAHTHSIPNTGAGTAAGGNIVVGSISPATATSVTPKYYALAYIMKL